jgi:queuine/archaeosine tRNA-ribosyltransferase
MSHPHVSKPAAAAASAAPTCNYYLNLMLEVREALDVGKFGEFVAKFHADRARGREVWRNLSLQIME